MSDKRCPICDHERVTSRTQDDVFEYGVPGAEQVELRAPVEVHSCAACKFEWTEADAEEARQRAVDDYLTEVGKR